MLDNVAVVVGTTIRIPVTVSVPIVASTLVVVVWVPNRDDREDRAATFGIIR